MNRIYKTVWNEQTGTFVAASEITRSRSKRSGGAVVAATVLAASMGLGGVAVADTIVQGGTNVSVESTTSGDDTTYTVNADGTTVSSGGSSIEVTPGTKGSNNVTDYQVDLSAATKTSIQAGVDAKAEVDKGLNFAGDSGTTVGRVLGDTVSIDGDGSNISTETTAAGVRIKLADTLNVNSLAAANLSAANALTVGGSATIGGALMVTGQLAAQGGLDMGGKPITNVGTSTATNAAATVGQLNALQASAYSGWTLQANGADGSAVASGGTVNFKNGANIAISKSGNELTIGTVDSPQFGDIKINDNGKITGVVGGDISENSDQVVTGGQLYDRLLGNDSGNNPNAGVRYFHARSIEADSQALSDDSVAIGPLARVDDSSTAGIAMGLGAQVNQNSENTIAIGTGAKSDPVENPAGSGLFDPAKDSVAIGTGATVSGSDAVAMGRESSAGTGSVGIGQSASAQGGNAVGIGTEALAVDGSSVALGHGAQALMNQDIAIGREAGAGSSGTPTADTQNIYIGSQAGAGVSNGGRNIAMGVQAGQGRGNDSDQNIAIGVEAGVNQTGRGNIAIGVGAARSVNTNPGVVETVAVGHEARTSNSYAVAVGSEAEAQGSNATAVGYNTVAMGGSSLALGANAQARYGKAVALGADSVADSVLDQIDQAAYLTGQSTEYSVSIGAAPDGGNSGFNRRISNVAGGFRDTDAVNVAQLRGAQQSVTQLIGGGVSVNPNGSYSQITIKDTGGVDHQFNTVVEAIGAVSSGTIDVSSPDAVMYADSSHSLITLHNDGTRITNVADGIAPGDAVNKGQMDSAIDASRTHYYSVNSTDTPNRNNEGATGADAIAAGMHAEAKGDNSVAIGHDSKAGHSDTTGGLAGIAVGYEADVRDNYGIAMGVKSRSYADHASAIGHDARADGLSSVALGHNASVEVVSNPSADDGIAIGTNSHVIADQGTAIGKNAWAYAGQAQAFGNEAKADENATRGVALGDHATTGSVDSYAIGTRASGSAADGFAIGSDAITAGASSYAIGDTAHSRGSNSFAMGTRAQTGTQADDSIAMGTGSAVIGSESIAVGAGNTIGTDTDDDGNPVLAGNRSGAFGNSNTIMQDNTFVVGNDVETTQANSVVLGNASRDRAATTVTGATIGGLEYSYAGPGAPEKGVVSVGREGEERQIINVAAGEISEDSTDAINGSQLYATNVVLGNVANTTRGILGGNAELGSDGQITMTDIGSTDKNTVHEAIQVARTEVVAGTNVASASKTRDAADGHDVYTINADGASVSAGSGAVAVTAGTKDASSNVTDYAVDLSQASKDSLGKADSAMQGFTTAVGGTTAQTLDQTNTQANFIAGDNIQLTGNATGITVATVADPNFTTVTTTGAITAGGMLNANGGLTVAAGQTVDMGGNQITNVAAGVGDTDAVNVSQLQQTAFNAGQNGPVVYTDADGNKVAKANDGNWYDVSVVNPDGSLIGSPTQVTEVIASMQSADGSTIDPTTLANVAAGKASTDAVNVSQLGAALGGDSIDADGNYVGPTYNILGDTYDNVGDAIAASTTHYYSVNSANQAAGSNYLNDGATGTGALAAGVFAQAAGSLGTAVGPSANSVGDRSAAVGYDAIAQGGSSIAMGASARAQQDNSVALGAGSEANEGQHTGAFTIDGSTAAGLNSGAGVVSIGSAGAERQIQNVAPGVLSATSTDAINGSQLFATNIYLANVANTTTGILGGNAALDDDGNITMTDIGGTGENTIDDAIRAAGTAANAGWNYTADGDAGTKTNVGPNGNVDFGNTDGNIKVSQNAAGDGLNFDLNENIDLGSDGSVKTGNTTMNNDGVAADDGAGNSSTLTTGGLEVADADGNNASYGADGMQVAGADGSASYGADGMGFTDASGNPVGPSVTRDGIDAGGEQITGVKSGLDGTPLADATGDMLNNAANIGDLQQAVGSITDAGLGGGFGLAGDDGNGFKQDLGTTAKITGDGNIKTGVVGNDTDGYALQVSLADDIALGGDGTDGHMGVRGADGESGVDLNGADGTIGLNNGQGSSASIGVADGTAGLDGNDGGDGASKTRIVYEKPDGSTEEVATLNDGLIFGANDGADHSAKLNTKVNVMGSDANTDFSRFDSGANIMTQMQGDTVRVALARDLNVDSVNAGGTVINSEGLYFVDAEGNRREDAPVVGPQGIDAGGNKITNVAPGTDPTDAVNVDQLGTIQRHVTEGQVMYDQHPDGSTNYESVTLNPNGEAPATIHNVAPGRAGTDAVNVNQLNALNDKIISNDRRASAGIAAAIATAGLPQAYLPGKSMFGIAAGTWRGETGFAMGLSRISDNGRWIIKGTATGSSRGDYGGSVGVGFQW